VSNHFNIKAGFHQNIPVLEKTICTYLKKFKSKKYQQLNYTPKKYFAPQPTENMY
jgi:hypothetical protein